MSNSIDNNFEGNNSMDPSISFIWIAIFKDGTKIEQFENDTEHRFQEVINKFNELAYFNLTDRKGHFFTVDLINGLIGYNYLALPYIELQEKKESIRLIFFRRHKVAINEQNLKEKSHTITYHLGYQYTNRFGNNQKIVLEIDKDGSFILGD